MLRRQGEGGGKERVVVMVICAVGMADDKYLNN